MFDDEFLLIDEFLDIIEKIIIRILVNIECTDYEFVSYAAAQRICDFLEIVSVQLIKSKKIREYDDRRAFLITHVIYSSMTVHEHYESLTSLLITHLDQQNIILEKL